MALFGLTAVRKNAEGVVVSAVVQQVDGKSRQWLGTASELDVGDIAAMIVLGDVIWSVFVTPEGSVLGPRACVCGRAGVRCDQPGEPRAGPYV